MVCSFLCPFCLIPLLALMGCAFLDLRCLTFRINSGVGSSFAVPLGQMWIIFFPVFLMYSVLRIKMHTWGSYCCAVPLGQMCLESMCFKFLPFSPQFFFIFILSYTQMQLWWGELFILFHIKMRLWWWGCSAVPLGQMCLFPQDRSAFLCPCFLHLNACLILGLLNQQYLKLCIESICE